MGCDMNPLPLPDQQHLNAAEGWLGLGDHLSANEELEQITPKGQKFKHPGDEVDGACTDCHNGGL